MSTPPTCFFNGNHLRYLAMFSKKVKGSCIEVVSNDESKHIICFMHETRTWKVEHIDKNGNVYMDFRKHLRKLLDGVEHVMYIKLFDANCNH